MDRSVDRTVLDLDRAAAEIQRRWFVWTAAGIKVHPITLTGDETERPARSLRWRVSRPNARAAVVLYAGGWAETAVRRPDAVATAHTTTQVDSIEAFGLLLDRVVQLISWSGRGPGQRHSSQARSAGAARGADWGLGFDGLPLRSETWPLDSGTGAERRSEGGEGHVVVRGGSPAGSGVGEQRTSERSPWRAPPMTPAAIGRTATPPRR